MKHGYIVVLLTAVLVACNSSSTTASDTLTSAEQTQVQSMINSAVTAATTPLKSDISTLQTQLAAAQATIKTLQANQPAVFIKSGSAAVAALANTAMRRTGRSLMSTGTNPCAMLGTLTGRPNDSDPLSSSIASGISCTNYYFKISEAATTTDYGYIQPLPTTVPILFDGLNCTGNMYLGSNFYGTAGVTPGVGIFVNGAVFRYDPQNLGAADSTTYYEVAAAQTPITNVTIQSYWDNSTNSCTSGVSFSTINLYAITPNDPATTGVNSAPVAGPVLIAN